MNNDVNNNNNSHIKKQRTPEELSAAAENNRIGLNLKARLYAAPVLERNAIAPLNKRPLGSVVQPSTSTVAFKKGKTISFTTDRNPCSLQQKSLHSPHHSHSLRSLTNAHLGPVVGHPVDTDVSAILSVTRKSTTNLALDAPGLVNFRKSGPSFGNISSNIDNNGSSSNLKRNQPKLAPVERPPYGSKPTSAGGLVNTIPQDEDKKNPFWFINRIRRHPNSLEFVYLNNVKEEPRALHNPYNLEIVPHSQINTNDYYTMSATGVTHFVNGEAEFTSLDQWVREHNIYQKILQIPFFQKYRVWKCLYHWRKYINSQKREHSEGVLANQLFDLNTQLQNPLNVVRSLCIDITRMSIYHHEKNSTVTLDKFIEFQKAKRDEAKRKLRDIYTAIKLSVYGACKSAMEANGFGPERFEDVEDGQRGDQEGTVTATPRVNSAPNVAILAGPGGQPTLNASGNGTDEPYRMTYTELSKKRALCRRLMNYIRLVDYMVMDSLVVLAMKSVRELLDSVTYKPPPPLTTEQQQELQRLQQHLEKEPNDKDAQDELSALQASLPRPQLPLFKTEVIFRDDSLVITPNRDNFETAVDGVVKGFIEVIKKTKRLMKEKEFKEFIEPVLEDQGDEVSVGAGPNISTLITGEKEYDELVAAIGEQLMQAFNNVEEYRNTFEPLRKMFLENRKMDINRLRDASNTLSLEFFRDEMKKYKNQHADVMAMEDSQNIGIFLVDSYKLKETFLPSPLNCLKDIQDLLPVLAKEKTDALFTDLNDAVKKLSSTPTTVDHFVQFLGFMDTISKNMDEIETRYAHVTDLYKLLEDEKVAVPADEKERYTIHTVSTIATLRQTLAINDEAKEANVRKFASELDTKIDEMRAMVQDIHERAKDPLISDEKSDIDQAIEYMQTLQDEMDSIKKRSKDYEQYQALFKVGVTTIEEIFDVDEDVSRKLKLWQSMKEWNSLTHEWTNSSLNSLDAESINNQVKKFSKVVFSIYKALPNNAAVQKLKKLVEEFSLTLPVVIDLRNSALKKRHWEDIEAIIGLPISTQENFTLGLLMENKILEKREEISVVSQTATNEATLEEMLKKVASLWQQTEFTVINHKDTKDVFILGGVEDIITQLEDNSIVVATIIGSRYVGPIKSQVEQWESDLKLMSETLDAWLVCQRQWLYLESIFGAPDISRQLPEEAKLFTGVDKFFKDLMKKTHENPNVFRSLTVPGLLDKINNANAQLEKIEKKLEKYLQTKRRAFPRFYFISNDDLLDILAQTKNPLAVQPHLMKCFENIKSLEFGKSFEITAMISSEGERVPIGLNLKARGSPEEWLSNVESNMVEYLRKATKEAWYDYEKRPRIEWIMHHPAQVVLTVSQIYWCRDVTACLESDDPIGQLKLFKNKSVQELAKLAALTRTELTRLERGMLCALITIDVHARDLVEQMIEDKVSSVSDFGWFKQLRYYWDVDEGDCFVRQTNSCFRYGYEYLGCQPRLVITPLTDRVYMTLTGALHLNLGGAPAGPAGTGKTETVKDLAKALARQCVVYNCSDGVTYQMMSKFLSGLVQTGAWACFDEFNRINIEVLSVIASQLLTIRNALLTKVDTFFFEEGEIPIKPTCGAFITMNPGYAGRTELPDNLKALFRPVSVMTPDFRLIAEVVLFSEGFENAKVLSRKMVQLYKLSSEQLSSQDHYDFGMRAVKSVLVMAGGLKRANPDVNEDLTLIRAMRDSNIPKFIADDVPLFQGILSDLFPGVVLPEQDLGTLQAALEDTLRSKGLQAVPTFITKILQLYETLIVRHGVMLVGPTGGGKTVCRDVLAETVTKLHANNPNGKFRPVSSSSLNPKSITYAELYGAVNVMTGEWTDGIIPVIVRQAVRESSTTEKPDDKWIIFDGPVDTLWIESMNSVLDDSKLLCLDNGERIKLNDNIRMMFEVQDLSVASPATVSRCGMVFMDPSNLGWMPSVQTWVQTQLPEELSARPDINVIRDRLLSLFDKHVQNGLNFVRKKCKMEIPIVELNLVTSICDLFKALIVTSPYVTMKNADGSACDASLSSLSPEHIKKLVNIVFMFSYTWSIGGNINKEFQEPFDDFTRKEFEDEVSIPGLGLIYDYCIDFDAASGETRFVPWAELVPEFKYDPATPFFQLVVPTVDTVRYSFLLKTLIQVSKPVLFNGVTGVGKSVIIANCLSKERDNLGIVPVTIQFSAQTSSGRTQEMIETKLEKKRKNILGAPPNKKVVLFVDDLNMPQLEEFGAQPPIELLRQIIGSHGFYERGANPFWKTVQDVTLIAACGPPGGGRNPVTPRLLRFFHMFNIPDLSDSSKKKIFESILSGFFEPFQEEIKALVKPMVAAGIDLYNRICEDLRPTPARSHYTFNLRDLAKVYQGILQITPRNASSVEVVTRLWIHEAMRCFHDRLIDRGDRRYFTDAIIDLLKRHFSMNYSHDDLFGPKQQPIMFADFMRNIPQEERQYEEVKDFQRLPQILDGYQDEYNMSSSKPMSLVFFRDAIEHISRIVRIIRQPRGNALLVGVGGSGKQSLTRLAAAIKEYQCFQIEIKRGYGLAEFRDNLKSMYLTAGVKGQPIVFLFSDTQIVNESFLEDINNILNSGEVPNLFAPDERERAINDVRPRAREAGVPETRDDLYQFFINSVRDNLHIVLCMSPVGDAFRARCRMFPSLVNCCTIDWFDEWPDDALLSVAQRNLEMVDLGADQSIRPKLAEMCVIIHSSVSTMSERFYGELRRRFYVTPTSYLEFINLYRTMIETKRQELGLARDRLNNGLQKLRETNREVEIMTKELQELQPILAKSSEETAALIEKVSIDTAKANEVRSVVAAEEAVVNEKTQEAMRIEADAKEDLAKALPALKAATKALDSLNKNDITEIKSYAQPPAAVALVMEAVLTLRGEKKIDWDTAKAVLADPAQFLDKCKNFDKDNISPQVLQRLEKYIEDPKFQPDIIGKNGSAAAKSLCIWVRAMDVYSKVAKQVEPKKQALREAQALLEQMTAELKEKQDRLNQVERELSELQKLYETKLQEKKDLEYKTELSAKRLASASKLTTALADEAVRWSETVAQLNNLIDGLPGNIFVSSACIAYYGAFTASYRSELVALWSSQLRERQIPLSDDFSIINVLSNPVKVREWGIWGLPSDNLSTENAILATMSRRWPLMIDPQGQANKWIKNMEAKNGLKVIKLSEPTYLRTLENSIRTGTPVLLEDVGESIDPALEPLLNKHIFKSGGRLLIRLGDSDITYDPNFRFYMTTKLANPHYLPDVCIKVTLINFTVTMKGLEDQLLGDVVRKLSKALEEQKDRLVVSMAADKKSLKEIEDKILNSLSDVQGNILDDQDLIKALDNSKFMSNVIKERVKEGEQTELELNTAREVFRSVAIRGSILYFVMADMANIDPMYQYSLEYFKKLFNMVIESSKKPEKMTPEFLASLTDVITETVYSNVCRGLFEKDKTIFSFLICVQIMRQRGDIEDVEWNFLLRAGSFVPKGSDLQPKPLDDKYSWLSDVAWGLLQGLENSIPAYAGICEDILNNPQEWKRYAELPEPQNEKLPIVGTRDWDAKTTDFQKLLLLKCLREEKLLFAVTNFVRQKLGQKFTESPPFDLEKALADTTASIPIIFVLSQGADPTAALLRFAKEKNYEDRISIISLGQGQGPRANKLIEKGRKSGDWVLLQNCHLAASYMPELEKTIAEFASQTSVLHKEFRLWLTSMPSASFPIPILQNGVKLTNEPPKGLRANLLRSYNEISEKELECFADSETRFAECTKAHAFKKLLFGMCFFHAIIQERKKFGPLGWNIKYEFNDSDLEVSRLWLKMFLSEQPVIPWDSLRYVIGEINYGGRVTDAWDRRCLLSILNHYFTPKILDDAYLFSESGKYKAPSEGDLKSYRAYIEQLPYTDDPDIFGMHENANILFQLQETQRMMGTVLSIQPRVANVGGGKTSEQIVAEQAADILERLPPLILEPEDNKHTPLPTSDPRSCLATVLSHETIKFNKLLRVMRETLVELQKAMKGLVVLSAALDTMFNNLLNNEVPALWSAVAYPSLKPLGAWVRDLHSRVEFMRSWLLNGVPSCFWMGGFFFPQGFITGVLQTYARKYKIPIDSLTFKFNVLDTDETGITEGPTDGVYIYGLFMDGARWDPVTRSIANSRPSEMYSPVPVIHFLPQENHERSPLDYQCPLYKTSVRKGVLSSLGQSTNFIIAVDLPTKDYSPDYWVLKGAALLCDYGN